MIDFSCGLSSCEVSFAGTCASHRCRQVHYSDHIREQAAHYRQLAETTDDPLVKAELLDLAATCDEVANKIDDRRASG